MNEKLYKKVGRKYVAINDPYCFDGLTEGLWVVNVNPNGHTSRIALAQDLDALDGSLEEFKQFLVDSLIEASKIKNNQKQTKKQERFWRDYVNIAGKDVLTLFQYDSLYDIASNAIESFKAHVRKTKKTAN
jgi:hypothetical protein